MAVKELVVGNLNIVFIGEKKKYDMLDFWEEIVSHVFVNDISYGRTPKFLLKDVQIKRLGTDSELAITGRYVKSTVLAIRQVLENNELSPRNEKHDSAPSSVFVYLLSNHILLYWGEHPGYPSAKSFKTFLSKCINKNRKKLIRLLSKDKKEKERIEIINKYPEAYVSYIPLPLTKNIEAQFSDITKINKLFVRQYFQNGNLDYSSVISTNQSLMDAVKSQRIDYSLVGISDIEGTKDLVSKIANAGDSKFIVDAKTKEGKKSITNDGVQYSEYYTKINENEPILVVAQSLYEKYSAEVKKGNIPSVPIKNSEDQLNKVKINE